MSSVDTDLTDGIAGLLQSAGVGQMGAATGTAIVAMELNPEPDRGIAIIVGGVGDNALVPVGQRTVQLRSRGTTDTRDVGDLAQSAFAVLHGVHGVTFGTTVLTHLRRLSYTSLGRDDRGRWERSDNYLADIAEPPSPQRLG